MEALHSCQIALTTQIETARLDLSIVKHDVQKIHSRITTADQRISDIEDTVTPLCILNSVIYWEIWWTISAEIIYVSLDSQRGRRVKTQKTWLKSIVGTDNLSALFAIERAHRVPMRPPPSGASPRPLLAKLLHFRDKDNILITARNLPEIKFNGNPISIFPDFSAATQKQRAAFTAVKRRLRDKQLSYSMLYPANLRVISDGKAQLSPLEASDWLDGSGRSLISHMVS